MSRLTSTRNNTSAPVSRSSSSVSRLGSVIGLCAILFCAFLFLVDSSAIEEQLRTVFSENTARSVTALLFLFGGLVASYYSWRNWRAQGDVRATCTFVFAAAYCFLFAAVGFNLVGH